MLLIRLISSEVFISLVCWFSLGLVVSLKISANPATHLLFIFHISGSIYLIHFWIVVFVSC